MKKFPANYIFYDFSSLVKKPELNSKDDESVFGKLKNEKLETLVLDNLVALNSKGHLCGIGTKEEKFYSNH